MAPRYFCLRQLPSPMSSIGLTDLEIGRDLWASAILTWLTPTSTDRLHYTQGRPGGGLEIHEA